MRRWRILITLPKMLTTLTISLISYRLARRRAVSQFRSTLRNMGLPTEAVAALAAEYPDFQPERFSPSLKA